MLNRKLNNKHLILLRVKTFSECFKRMEFERKQTSTKISNNSFSWVQASQICWSSRASAKLWSKWRKMKNLWMPFVKTLWLRIKISSTTSMESKYIFTNCNFVVNKMRKEAAMLAELKLPASERTNLRHKIRWRMVPLAKLSVNRATGTSMQTKSMLRTITAIRKSSDIEGVYLAYQSL